MSTLRAVFLISFPLAIISACGLGAIAIWAYFASGDCSMWVINQVLMRDSIKILGSDYFPECVSMVRPTWSFLIRVLVLSILVAGASMAAINFKKAST